MTAQSFAGVDFGTLVAGGFVIALVVVSVVLFILRFFPLAANPDLRTQQVRTEQLQAEITKLTGSQDTLMRLLELSDQRREDDATKRSQLEQQTTEQGRQLALLSEELSRLKSELDTERRKAADVTRQLEEKQYIEKQPPPVPSVLLVAPNSNLPLVRAETDDIARSGLEVTPAYSPVTLVSLTREIRSSKSHGLWLLGHMGASGDFPLDSGQILTSSALTSLVRGRFEWVFINACQSVYAAQQLQNETGADVICTILDVLDDDAYRTGSLFASALAQFRDPRTAYDESRPGGNRIYLYLGGRRKK